MDQQVTQTQTEKEELSPNLVMTPGKMRVIKRNGKVVSFEEEKIKVAIMKAFLAVEGGTAAGSSRIHEAVEQMTKDIAVVVAHLNPSAVKISSSCCPSTCPNAWPCATIALKAAVLLLRNSW